MSNTMEHQFDNVIADLEKRLSESTVAMCKETAELCRFYEGVTFQGAYVTALLQKYVGIKSVYEMEVDEDE